MACFKPDERVIMRFHCTIHLLLWCEISLNTPEI